MGCVCFSEQTVTVFLSSINYLISVTEALNLTTSNTDPDWTVQSWNFFISHVFSPPSTTSIISHSLSYLPSHLYSYLLTFLTILLYVFLPFFLLYFQLIFHFIFLSFFLFSFLFLYLSFSFSLFLLSFTFISLFLCFPTIPFVLQLPSFFPSLLFFFVLSMSSSFFSPFHFLPCFLSSFPSLFLCFTETRAASQKHRKGFAVRTGHRLHVHYSLHRGTSARGNKDKEKRWTFVKTMDIDLNSVIHS
jgi:hypothetical protein